MLGYMVDLRAEIPVSIGNNSDVTFVYEDYSRATKTMRCIRLISLKAKEYLTWLSDSFRGFPCG